MPLLDICVEVPLERMVLLQLLPHQLLLDGLGVAVAVEEQVECLPDNE